MTLPPGAVELEVAIYPLDGPAADDATLGRRWVFDGRRAGAPPPSGSNGSAGPGGRVALGERGRE